LTGGRFLLPHPHLPSHHPTANMSKTTRDWQVATLTIPISQNNFKMQKINHLQNDLSTTGNQTQTIVTVPVGSLSSTCYRAAYATAAWSSVPGQFILVITLLSPHPQLPRQLVTIPLFTKPQQQLRSKSDAVRQSCEAWQCLQALTTTSCNKDPHQRHVLYTQHCQFLQFIPTSCNTWHS